MLAEKYKFNPENCTYRYQLVYQLIDELWEVILTTIKIYARGRLKVGAGVKQPQFRVLAVTSDAGERAHQVRIAAIHFRKVELEQIAKDVGAEIIYLEPIPQSERGKMKEKS